MLAGCVIQDHVDDEPDPAFARLFDELFRVFHRSEIGVDRLVIRNVVPVIVIGRRIKRADPDRAAAEFLHVIEFFDDPGEIANAVAVRVTETPRVDLINDAVFPPFGFTFNSVFPFFEEFGQEILCILARFRKKSKSDL